MKHKVMLAEIGSLKDLKKENFIYEPKLDGTRVLIYKNKKIKIINRRNRDITFKYPELKEIKKNINAKKCVLDAELVVLEKGKPNFNLLQKREQIENKFLIEIRSREFPATLFVFDILEKDNKILTEKKLYERKKILEKTITNSPFISKCFYTKEGEKLWKKIKKENLEGVMAKNLNSKYEEKRSREWLKIKNINTIDAIIIGFTKGRKSRKKYFGSLLLGAYKNKKLIYIGKVGTGFNEKLLREMTKIIKKFVTNKFFLDKKEKEKIKERVIWVKPKLIAEIKYLEITKNKELRAPSFKRLRFDKKLEDCTI